MVKRLFKAIGKALYKKKQYDQRYSTVPVEERFQIDVTPLDSTYKLYL